MSAILLLVNLSKSAVTNHLLSSFLTIQVQKRQYCGLLYGCLRVIYTIKNCSIMVIKILIRGTDCLVAVIKAGILKPSLMIKKNTRSLINRDPTPSTFSQTQDGSKLENFWTSEEGVADGCHLITQLTHSPDAWFLHSLSRNPTCPIHDGLPRWREWHWKPSERSILEIFVWTLTNFQGPHFTILVLQSPYVVFHPQTDSLLVGMVTIQTRRVIPQHDI